MSYEEIPIVSEDNNGQWNDKAHKKAMKKLEASKTDITKMSLIAIVWHIVVRYKRIIFWTLGVLGWVLFIKTWIGL